MQARIYLDHNASTPLSPAAREAWLRAQDLAWGNPSAVHREGQLARHAVDSGRKRLASRFGCQAHELVVCSGGSEALALAMAGLWQSGQVGRILHGAADHSAVTANAGAVAGAAAQAVAVDAVGRMRVEALAAALAASAEPALVCLLYAHNELGCLADLPALVACVREQGRDHRILLDAAHGAGKRPIDLAALDLDCAAISGHKFGAPKASGALFLRQGLRIAPQIRGGGQQQDRRSGTEDPAQVAALAAALDAGIEDFAAAEARLEAACQAAWAIIHQALPAAHWLGREAPRLPGTMLLLHPGLDAASLLPRLDLAGFALSRGAACAAARTGPSPTLLACGLSADLAASAIRVSAAPGNADSDLPAFARAYVDEVRALLG